MRDHSQDRDRDRGCDYVRRMHTRTATSCAASCASSASLTATWPRAACAATSTCRCGRAARTRSGPRSRLRT
eukprot:365362-Chlamydomonas_euryale.AAC.27